MEAMAAEWHAHGVRQAQQQAQATAGERGSAHQLAQGGRVDAAQCGGRGTRRTRARARRRGGAAGGGSATRGGGGGGARRHWRARSRRRLRRAARRSAAAAERRGVEAARHAAAPPPAGRGGGRCAAEAAHAQLTLAHREASERAAAAQLLESRRRSAATARAARRRPAAQRAAPLAQPARCSTSSGSPANATRRRQALGAAHQQLRQLDAERPARGARARPRRGARRRASASGFTRAQPQPAAPAGGVGGTDAAAAVETVTAKLSGFSWLKSASAKVGETAIGAIGDLRSVAGGGDDGRVGHER